MSVNSFNNSKNIINDFSSYINLLEKKLLSGISTQDKINEISRLIAKFKQLESAEADLKNATENLLNKNPKNIQEIDSLKTQVSQLKIIWNICYNKCQIAKLNSCDQVAMGITLSQATQDKINNLNAIKDELNTLFADPNLNTDGKKYITIIIKMIDEFLVKQPVNTENAILKREKPQEDNSIQESNYHLNFDVWLKIISLLSPQDLLNLGLVNKDLNQICNEHYAWKLVLNNINSPSELVTKNDFLKQIYQEKVVLENLKKGFCGDKSICTPLLGHNFEVYNDLIYCANGDHKISVLDLNSANEVDPIMVQQPNISSLHINGKLLFIGSTDYINNHDIQIWDLERNSYVTNSQVNQKINSFSSYGNSLYSGSQHEIEIQDLNTLSHKGKLHHMGNINCLERSGKWLFSGSSFGSVKVWDLETNALVKLLKREKLGPITQICVYKNLLISATGKQEIIIWDLNDYSLAKTIQIDGKIANIAIMNNLLLACLQNGCIKVFNMNTYSNVSTFQSLPTRSIKIKNNCIITSAVAGMRTTKMHVLDFNFDPAQFLDIANATLNQRNHLVEQFETLGYSCQMAILNEYNTLSNLDELNEMDFFSNPITDPVKLNNLAEAIYRVVLKEVFNHLDNGQRRYAFNLFKKLPEAFIQAHLDELIAKLGPDAKRILKEYFNINIDKQ